jgi:hypothetical protein
MDNRRPDFPSRVSQDWLEVVRQHVESLRFGTVEIIVHDARVTQIQKTERLRFDKSGAVQASDPVEAEVTAKTSPGNNTFPQ